MLLHDIRRVGSEAIGMCRQPILESRQVIDDLSDQALRVLAVAYRPMPELPYQESDKLTADQKFKMLRKDLQLIGLFASIDPEREGVPQVSQPTRIVSLS